MLKANIYISNNYESIYELISEFRNIHYESISKTLSSYL